MGYQLKKPHFRAYFIYFFDFSLIFLNLFRSWSQFKADSRQPILLLGKVNKSDEFPKTQNHLIKRHVYQIKLEIVKDNSRIISLSFIKEIITIVIITIITYMTSHFAIIIVMMMMISFMTMMMLVLRLCWWQITKMMRWGWEDLPQWPPGDRSHIILKLNRPLQWRSLILQTKLFLSTRIMPAKVSDSVWAKSKFRGFLNLPLHASAAQLGFDIVIKCGYSFGMDRGA